LKKVVALGGKYHATQDHSIWALGWVGGGGGAGGLELRLHRIEEKEKKLLP